MTTTKMTKKSLSSLDEKYANSFKGADKAAKYDNSLKGVLDHITKFWSHGYDSAFQSLAITTTDKDGKEIKCNRMKTLRPWIEKLIEKQEGLDSRMTTLVTDNKGEQKTVFCTWKAHSIENKNVTAIVDAKGKNTYPNITVTDDKGKERNAQVDAPSPFTKWTPTTLHLFIVQNMALLSGELTPYTEADFMADYDIDAKSHATRKATGAPKALTPNADADAA